MTRATKEWIATHDDQAIPPRVKARLFIAADKRCQKCTRLLVGRDTPEYDHAIALVNGGEHRESNLQVLCEWCHAKKTKADVAEKSVTARKRRKDIGIKKARRTIPGRRFDGTPIPSRWVG